MNKFFAVLSFCGYVLASTVGFACEGVPENNTLYFDVYRKGDVIGKEVFHFNHTGDQLNVNVATNITVDVAFITVYRYEHSRQETWQNHQLTSFQSKTHDNGTDHTLNIALNGDKLHIASNTAEWDVDSKQLPVSFWCKDTMQQNVLFSALNGKPYNVQTTLKGSETIQLSGGNSIEADHYVMTGDLPRDIWYDKNGILAKVAFTKDDSYIEYIRK